MSEPDDYLQPGFDPSSITVPRLRSILVTHNVPYPGTAKKPQLIEIFNDQVVPRSNKILAERARARRTSKGIVNAGSEHDPDTFDHTLPPPRTSGRARSPRKASSVVKSEEPEEVPQARKRASRSASKQLQTSDTDSQFETEAPRVSHRSRRTATPQVKAEPVDDEGYHVSDNMESAFSDENPFQSGSSPPPGAKSSTGRRKTTGMDNLVKSTPAARRRTDGGSLEARTVSSSSNTFSVPVSRLRSKTPEVQQDIDAGEDFTPEEQLELAHEMAENRSLTRDRETESTRSTSFTTPLLVLLLTIFGAYGAWFRQEKIAVGFCGVGREPRNPLPPSITLPDFLVPFVEVQCDFCPAHAFCQPEYSVQCENSFMLKPHPLSLGGLVPLPPTCEPDGEMAKKVKAVADRAIEELRIRRAQYECGEADGDGVSPDSPNLGQDELKEKVEKIRTKRLTQEEFDDLWEAAIGEIKARDEVEVMDVSSSDPSAVPNTRLSSTSHARVPLVCAIKRSVSAAVERNRLSIGLLVAAVLAIYVALARYRAHVAIQAQIPDLVNSVLERLATQRELGDDDIDEPWLFLPHLRDDVLKSIHSFRERERIWKKVQAIVEQNSNVRTGQREGRSGEVGRAWEWIGSTPATANRRRSGRVSFGPDVKSGDEDTPEMSERRASPSSLWKDSRPMY